MLRLRLGEDENVGTLPEEAEAPAASPVSLSIAGCTLAPKVVKADQVFGQTHSTVGSLRPSSLNPNSLPQARAHSKGYTATITGRYN